MTTFSFDLTEGTRLARQHAPPGSLTTGRVDVTLDLPGAEIVHADPMRLGLQLGGVTLSLSVGAARYVGAPLRNEALSIATRLACRDGSGRRAEVREVGVDRHLVIGWNHTGLRSVVGLAGFEQEPVYVDLSVYPDDARLAAVVDLVERALRTVSVRRSSG